MKEGLILTAIYALIILIQPFLPSVLGDRFWLLSMTPILISYVSMRARGAALGYFIILCGLLHDLMFPDYLGMGPLLWGLTVFLIHSQYPWIHRARFFLVMVAVLVASFFYLCMDRLLVLFYAGFWSWSYEMLFSIFWQSCLNAIVSPLLFFIFDAIVKGRINLNPVKQRAWVQE
ncbi:MAG: hypothetical protein AAFY98_00860 [Verrucomicrobiota bacterium]